MPDSILRRKGFEGQFLDPDGGLIALQAHDPESTLYFRNVQVRRLPRHSRRAVRLSG